MGLIILGIDPGTIHTGYGVISLEGDQVQCLDYGSISPCPKKPFPQRVQYIYKNLKQLYIQHKPHHTAVEKVFFSKNPDTAFKLGHIFALCLLLSEKQGSEFFEYPTRVVKKTLTFSGGASKILVQKFVANFLRLSDLKTLDATDALAVALCHSRYSANLAAHKNQQKSEAI